tara:strand:- start:140 stop:1168 length:1029 start_codon:yes stop_codon:yes gene_type:complete
MSKAAELANLIGNINAGGGGVNRNVIINSAMTVSQRGTSFNQPADGAYTLDRFFVFRNGAGIMDVEQSTTVPSGEGFKNSLKCTVDTVDTSLGSTDFGGLATKLEGQDLVRFNFGQSTAKQFVLSFFVRSNITGTYSVAFRNGSSNRYLVKEYTISSADTWQKITITNLADNTGTWATDNTTGLDIRWCLWEGGFSASADTWGAGNIIGSSSNVNWATSTDNNFYITGVQLEVGQNPTEFEHINNFGEELARCQRYFLAEAEFKANLFADEGSRRMGGAINFPVTMRSAPTMGSVTDNSGSQVSSSAISGSTVNCVRAIFVSASGSNSNIECFAKASADAEL